MPKKKSKGGPLSLGDFWGEASLAGDEDPKDPWRVGGTPWRYRGRWRYGKRKK